MAEWRASVFFSKKCGKSDVITTVGYIGDSSIRGRPRLLNKLLARIAVARATTNKMAHTVSWFDFLFDTTGELLKKHLGDVSAG